MIGYYDRAGKPIDYGRFVELSRDPNYVRVALDEFDNQRVALDEFDNQSVSTVWLGIDHNSGRGPLAIFETMIFGGEHDADCRRYPSEGAALQGHRDAVNNLHHGRAPW